MTWTNRHPNPEHVALLGNEVLVLNPEGHSSWAGRGIALSYDPSIVIERVDGRRLMLPLAWAHRVFDEPGPLDPQSQVGSAIVGHGPEPYTTLGHVAAEVRRMRDDGVTRESIEFVLGQVYG